jgi:hypothetical protein
MLNAGIDDVAATAFLAGFGIALFVAASIWMALCGLSLLRTVMRP